MECMILGGDKRFVYLAEDMRKHGDMVYEIKTEEAYIRCMEEKVTSDGANRLLILPMPVVKGEDKINGCEDIYLMSFMKQIPAFSYVCGGVLPEEVTDVCRSHGIFYYDFMKDDGIACKNAVATAEGAIAEVFMMSDINLDGSKCLVTGYGRCAVVLAEKLRLLGAEVTVTARREDACLQAKQDGFDTILLQTLPLSNQLSSFDYCFNTIPAMVLTREILMQLQQDVVLIDIASAPGGTEFEVLKERGIRYRHSLGIPGRYSPKTSGEILAEGVCRWLSGLQEAK